MQRAQRIPAAALHQRAQLRQRTGDARVVDQAVVHGYRPPAPRPVEPKAGIADAALTLDHVELAADAVAPWVVHSEHTDRGRDVDVLSPQRIHHDVALERELA